MTKRKRKVPPPVVRTLSSLVEGPLPSGPVILHIEKAQFRRIDRKARLSRGRIRPGTKGVLVVPDPFGNYLGFLVCASKSGEGNACIPLLRKASPGVVTFGNVCLCIGGRDPVERWPVEECALKFDAINGFSCTGQCLTKGKKCTLWRSTKSSTAVALFWCGCA